jgi:FO synthase
VSPDGHSLSLDIDELERLGQLPLAELMAAAAALRDHGHGDLVSWSRKVFIPLTRLCRDSCHYCTFAAPPSPGDAAYLDPEEVLGIARAGAAHGCKEALFTLGDKPELRYRAARSALEAMGFATTVDYVEAMARRVLEETGLLPHVNAGVLDIEDYRRLRRVSPSMGLMLENAAPRLAARGGPHFGSPDKHPAVRLASLRAAGEARVPLTTGLLVGIGETRRERLESLVAIRELHAAYGHIQEVIVQNFLPKPDTRMRYAPAPPADELLWTIAMARIVLGPGMGIQAPPNLNAGRLGQLVAAGIDDWGGVSPVTVDHVNPESPWPVLRDLEEQTTRAGKVLVERLTVRPPFVRDVRTWVDDGLRGRVLGLADASGLARGDGWMPGSAAALPGLPRPRAGVAGPRNSPLHIVLDRAAAGRELDWRDVARLLEARGDACVDVLATADRLRAATCGERVSYVVNRNINYTNVCTYKCSFCAFSKGRIHAALRGAPYLVGLEEIERRSAEAWARGATEVCMQGGIHPSFDGRTYLEICKAARRGAPRIHVHAFSPLEITHGAATLRMPVGEYLLMLREHGLSTLPGTAAEILDDDVRAVICPDKLSSRQWLDVVETAHRVGIRTTSTMMFGHVDTPGHWARHLLALRELQARTGGLTEFVPLPFVPMEAPLFRRGHARSGPTFREVLLVHAVARLVLHPLVTNIQASWPKLGAAGAAALLDAGANDLGGTLMNESISRAAGAAHGEEFPPADIEAMIRSRGREPWQRTTLYAAAPAGQQRRAFAAGPLAPPVVESARPARTQRGRPAETSISSRITS